MTHPARLVLAVLALSVAVPVALAQTVDDLVAPIRAAVSSPDDPFTLLIEITIRPGHEAAFERAFAPAVAETRREPGNLAFELSRSPRESNVYMLYERWASLADVEAHMGRPHMAAFWPVYFPMLARAPEFEVLMVHDLVD